MPVQESDVVLYHLSLQRQSNYVASCTGRFAELPGHEVAPGVGSRLQLFLATETCLELFNVADGRLERLASWPLFASIKTIAAWIPVGATPRDVLLVTSDAGNLTLLSVERDDSATHGFRLETLVNESMHRSGMRRVSPIAYSAVDRRQRCAMVSALEKFKLCYMLGSGATTTASPPLLSSPLEIVRTGYITQDLVSCDMEYTDNPVFAALEILKTTTHLIFYMVDLNLNHIIKKADFELPEAQYDLILALPNLNRYGIRTNVNETDEFTNPFVILANDTAIWIRDMQGQFNIELKLPRRTNATAETHSIITGVTHTLKDKFFVLLQNELGDLFKLQIERDPQNGDKPKCSCTYFDTIPRATKLHIFSNGYMFLHAEYNDNALLQIESLGSMEFKIETEYTPRTQEQENLSVVERQLNLNPLLSANVDPGVPFKIITNTSDGEARLLTNAVKLKSLITAPLPPNPKKIWALKTNIGNEYHELLVIAFNSLTTFLKTSGDSIENLNLPSPPAFIMKHDQTLHIATLTPNYIIQVCRNLFVQVRTDTFKCVHTWYPPAGIHIVSAASTQTQLALALSNSEIIYFEIYPETNTLIESTKILTMESKIKSISLDITSNRSIFMVVATEEDQLVSIVKVQSQSPQFMEVVSLQRQGDAINEVLLVESVIHIGLMNGVYVRSTMSLRDSEIVASSEKYIGGKPITMSFITETLLTLRGTTEYDESDDEEEDEKTEDKGDLTSAVLIHSNSTWISYEKNQFTYIRPLSLPTSVKTITTLSQFKTDNIKRNGCCCLSSSGELVIGNVQDFIFNDHWFNMSSVNYSVDGNQKIEPDAGGEEEEEEEDIDEKLPLPAFRGKKVLRLSDMSLLLENSIEKSGSVRVSVVDHLGNVVPNSKSAQNYQILAIAYCYTGAIVSFTAGTSHLVLSTDTYPNLLTYKINILKSKNKKRSFNLELVYETTIGKSIRTLSSFGSMLLVVVYGQVVLFGAGKKQLLKKSITKLPPSIKEMTAFDCWEDHRIAIGDIHQSVTVMDFDQDLNTFIPVADDVVKRFVTCLKFLDNTTVIGGDRFGNIWTLRVPTIVDGVYQQQKLPGNLLEVAKKLVLKNHFYVNDIPTEIFVNHAVQNSDRPVVIYTGIQGTIGALIPLLTKNQIKTIKKLETSVANIESLLFKDSSVKLLEDGDKEIVPEEESWINKGNAIKESPEGYSSIVGRDHTAYRSYYAPSLNIIDGDLCETFVNFSEDEQGIICKSINKKISHKEVLGLINEFRTNHM
ncbi:U2 snRNP complex subunit RSE1 KNAG_0G00350 [Huiozyma naganishii CBS 8797]|uniref:DNA damage-binding protein 1 n=1 Tax=Huiozyma naganishii (strain ATCC MYA-139 / BCRC 22969 / CBS 8797 / KCTC 17520 / NBRC 10181 / NCYC 3082 / Yp74L-3) TaxID=1071383 RepID=J7S0P8_HUIN7|nr:hypothetical protein KNAG_0G00350 [Kazachstania naganishii CBS 8797]CCK71092.1 hypothetical protein KNAG_0G00350 [Kazachstania naganishii CBS 8797]